MARPWRIQYEDAVYHITSRGNNQQDIFHDDADRKFFLKLMERVSTRFNLQIFAFCLMNNHFHLFVGTPEANLSKSMQWLNGTYTGFHNWRYKRHGHLLQGRYKSVVVLEQEHWLRLSMYIHLNPVRAGVVDDPAKYPWSSYLDYISAQPRFAWLRRDEILADYGNSRLQKIRNYRKDSLAMIGQKPEFIEQLKNGIFIGAEERLKELVNKYRPSGKIKSVPEYGKAARKIFNADQELVRVANIFGVNVTDLKRRQRNFPPRLAAFYHLVENCRMSVNQTAGLTRVGISAVSAGIRKARHLMLNDNTFNKNMERLSIKSSSDPNA